MERVAAPSGPVALRLWIWTGFASFGGPAAQIGLLHREYVERRRWVDESEFQRALSLCMVLPGPEALQLAIYLGWRLHRVGGGVLAGLCFLLPAVLLLLGLSCVHALYGQVPVVAGVFYGLEATIVALIGHALYRLARRALDTPLQWLIACSALAALVLTRLPYPLLLLAAAAAGSLGQLAPGRRAAPAPAAQAGRGALASASLTAAAGIALWAAPLVALALVGVRGLPVRLYLFLSKASLLTFGGAYAIVKYVSDDFVHAHGWITLEQSVAGLALAETTPGPLMIVLQFFGFAAGWNEPATGSRLFSGALCALLATYASFLPSFVLVLMAAPHVDRVTSVPALAAALRGVTAFVVGVIASLGLTVAGVVLLSASHDGLRWGAVAIAIGAGTLLARPRIGLHWVLVLGALAGCALRQLAV